MEETVQAGVQKRITAATRLCGHFPPVIVIQIFTAHIQLLLNRKSYCVTTLAFPDTRPS